MSIFVRVDGTAFKIPEQGDSYLWGTDFTNWVEAISEFTGNIACTANVVVITAAYNQANAARAQANLAYDAANDAVQSVVAANASNLAITTVSGVVTIDTKLTGGGGTANIAAGPGILVSGNLVSLNVANDITWTGNNKWTGPHGTTVANSFGLLVGSGSQGANQFLQTITVGNTSAANFSTWRWLTQNTGFISLTSFNDARNASFDALFIQKGSLGNVQAFIIGDTSNTTLITARGLFNVTANLYIAGNDVGLAIANSYNQANLALTTAQNSNLTIQAGNTSNLSIVYTGNTVTIDTKISGGGGGDPGPAFDQANAAFNQANAAFSQANTATTIAEAAFMQANTALVDAGLSFSQASAAYANGNVTAAQVTLAFNKANTGGAANVQTTANQISVGAATSNNILGYANLTYDPANSRIVLSSKMALGYNASANAVDVIWIGG